MKPLARYSLFAILLAVGGWIVGGVMVPALSWIAAPLVIAGGYFLVRAWWEFAQWMWRVLTGDRPRYRHRNLQ